MSALARVTLNFPQLPLAPTTRVRVRRWRAPGQVIQGRRGGGAKAAHSARPSRSQFRSSNFTHHTTTHKENR
jgi:hypothetical protein